MPVRSRFARAGVCLGWMSALLVAGCTGGDAPAEPEPWEWSLPPGFPEPLVPADNPMTVEKVALGEALFHDARLSWNESLSCATCHDADQAFADGLARPEGSEGTELPRNAMGLLNAAWLVPYTWANPELQTLEEQALVPLFGDFPLELGLQRDTDAILARLAEDPELAAAFEAAYPEAEDPVTTDAVVQALASYQRTLVSAGSAYDRFTYDADESAMSEAAQRGMALFFSERTECYHCHGGFLFTSAVRSAAQPGVVPAFFNTGLYDVGGMGDYPTGNQGLYEVTGDPADRGKFRVPSLRNVAVTAPYMHDGSIATLAEVVATYSAGGRHIEDGEHAGDGRSHPNKDVLVFELGLEAGEQADLVAFLEALTDARFLEG
jgi:cytochrome c peroxidase